MLVSRQMHLHWEILKWMAIISLAVATAIIFATQLASGSERPPTVASDFVPLDLSPLTMQRNGSEFRESADVPINVWQALEAHRLANWELAIVIWHSTELPGELQVWKHVAVAQAHLKMAQIDEAEAELELARLIHPENAVVRFFSGMLRLEQSALAEEWYEPQKSDVVFVAYMPVVPNTRSMYRLAAINELHAAISHAGDLHADTLLVGADSPTEAALLPTVGDLLIATGTDRFVGKAHHTLGVLYLENSQLKSAEKHLDAAYDAGMTIDSGYADLGKRYQVDGHHADAARAFAKAMARQPGISVPGIKTLKSVRDAIREIW